jgi:hypothetical protein
VRFSRIPPQPAATPERESELNVTVSGPEEETPEQWADLVETVLEVLAEERRKRDGGGQSHAA